MTVTAMTVGQNIDNAVGSSGTIVGRQGSALMNTVTAVGFLSAVEGFTREIMGPPPMTPGQDLRTTLGASAEMYALTGSKLGLGLATTMAEVGIVSSLISMGTRNSLTPDQQAAAVAHDEQVKAAIADDQAKRDASVAEDAQRKEEIAKADLVRKSNAPSM